MAKRPRLDPPRLGMWSSAGAEYFPTKRQMAAQLGAGDRQRLPKLPRDRFLEDVVVLHAALVLSPALDVISKRLQRLLRRVGIEAQRRLKARAAA